MEQSEKNTIISLRDIFVRFDGEVILNHINLDFKDKEFITILGPSGCGKTTLINLLLRFYDVDGGSIKVDGKNINGITRHSLRYHFGMVLQDTWIKNGTVRENIAFGKPDATEEEMIEAAKKARCHDFILALPDGYDTVVGEGGGTLSGGELQRVLLALALEPMPNMLILDEPLSGVDVEGMSLLMDMLDEIRKKFDLSILMTTHDFSMLERYCDQVVLLQGKILRRGTPLDVLSSDEFAKAFHMGGGTQA